jgi:hypothetical protein
MDIPLEDAHVGGGERESHPLVVFTACELL